MSSQIRIVDPVVLTAVAAIIGGVVPDNTKRVFVAPLLVNPTAAAVVASLYLVPAGGAPGAGNVVVDALTIDPHSSYYCSEIVNLGLNAGGSLQALGLALTLRYTARDITNG